MPVHTRHAALLAAICLGASTGFAFAQPATQPASESSAADRYGHLAQRPAGPGWSVASIAATVPAGVVALPVDPGRPVPPVVDPQAAIKAALTLLARPDKAGHDLAYRITGATVNGTRHVPAIKLLAYLQHHGVGTRADAGAAVRTSMQLVKAGDRDACTFVADADPKTFAATCHKAGSIRKLLAGKTTGAFRVQAAIASVAGDGTVMLRDDGELPVKLKLAVDRIEPGRVMNVAGYYENGAMLGLVAVVPEPEVDFQWKLIQGNAPGGGYHLRTVSVTVRNKGVQPIKELSFQVRCTSNADSRERSAEIGELAPGRSRTVEVKFSMYNWYYGVSNGSPRASVNVERVEW